MFTKLKIPFVLILTFILPFIFEFTLNLIPIYPLDGSKILYGLLPDDIAREYDSIMSRYGTVLLLLLIIPFTGTSALSALISPVITFFLNLLIP